MDLLVHQVRLIQLIQTKLWNMLIISMTKTLFTIKNIGNYLKIENIDDALKLDILSNSWVPLTSYNFKNDLKSEKARPF